MATKAFILIETVVGKNREVVSAIQRLKGIKSADSVAGPYDVIAVIEADNITEIGDTITSELHTIDGVSRTVTCLVV
ncbi:MAG TPA: Lrp/AsnC family transcriptional regulator [Dehalococcoidia bacterium]|nr:Lrp/AsnC family transcriptional regulator [Dehalococcoidia bacterium]